MTSHFTARLSWLALTSAALLLTQCVDPEGEGPDGTTPPPTEQTTTVETRLLPDTEYSRDLVIFDHVEVLDAEQAVGMTKTATELTLPDLTQIDRWQVGDVIVSDVGDGVFRYVLAVAERDGKIVLTTRPAELTEAIASGEIYFAKLAEDGMQPQPGFEEGSFTPSSPEGLITNSQSLEYSKGWNGTLFSYNKDFSGPINKLIGDDHVQFTAASFSAQIGAEVYARIATKGWLPPRPTIDGTRLATNGKAVAELRVKLQSDDAFSTKNSISIVGPGSTSPLLRVEPISYTLIPRLFPIRFTFDVTSVLDYSASVDGQIQADLGYKIVAGATAGVERKDGRWSLIRRQAIVPQRYGPVFSGEKKAEFNAELTTTVSLTIGEKVNGFARFKPANVKGHFSQEINADTKSCPTKLSLDAEGTFESQLQSVKFPWPIGTKTFQDQPSKYTLYKKSLFDYNEQLNIPLICDGDYMPPTNDGEQLAGEKCASTDECVSVTECFQDTCVTRGDFRVSAAWFEATDGDIYVETPSGVVVSYSNTNKAGGRHDFSSCYRGCEHDGPYVESVYFNDQAADGAYKVWVTNYSGENGSSVEFEVKQGDQSLTFQGMLPAEAAGQTAVFEFQVNNGKISK